MRKAWHRNAVSDRQGFSLVEMSILILVLAILTAVALIFKTLIDEARIHSQVKQIKDYQLATGIFQVRFFSLPGDTRKALQYELGVAGGPGDNGNGNRRIGDTSLEAANFWIHLAHAGMIDFDPAGTLPYPLGKIGEDTTVTLYFKPSEMKTYFHLGLHTNPAVNPLMPLEAYKIDLKLDDGDPSSGDTLAARAGPSGTYGLPTSVGAGGVSRPVCVRNDVAPTAYNLENDSDLCSLDIQLKYDN